LLGRGQVVRQRFLVPPFGGSNPSAPINKRKFLKVTLQKLDFIKKASFFEEAFFDSSGTYIHPTAIIGHGITLGENVKIGPYCVLVGNMHIEANTRLYAHVTIGFPAQVTGLKESLGLITIGQNCEIREFVTIHAARAKDGKTVIGNNCYIMNYCHISHDCVLEDNVTLINNVNLGGHTHIEKQAFLMANAATHQFCRVGQFSAIAPFSGTRQDLPPFCLFSGQPAAFSGLNSIALKRSGLTEETITPLKHVTKLFYQDKLSLASIKEAAQKESAWGHNRSVMTFISFIEQSSRGVSRKTLLDISEETLTL
jgi:UDP-N-acetylglucosamine acyltransferase